MIPNYNDATVPSDWDPFAVTYYVPSYSDVTTASTLTHDPWQTNSTVEFYIPAQPQRPVEVDEDTKEAILAFKRAVAHAALLEAQRDLRTARDDPSPRIPLHARKGLSGRPATRKRVCAGSSRYRVLVN